MLPQARKPGCLSYGPKPPDSLSQNRSASKNGSFDGRIVTVLFGSFRGVHRNRHSQEKLLRVAMRIRWSDVY